MLRELYRRRRSGLSMCSGLSIYQVFQLFAGLKERDLLGGNFHTVASLGIASDPRLALAGPKAAKSTDLDFVASPQGAYDAVENRLDDHFAVFARLFRQTGDFINQVRFCHSLFAPLSINFLGRSPRPLGLGPSCPGYLKSTRSKNPRSHNLLKFQGLLARATFRLSQTMLLP
jgi:hypothetical protein